MNLYARLILSLTATSAVAGGLLAYTYASTAPVIAQREIEDQKKALESVFFLQKEGAAGKETLTLSPKPLTNGVTALYLPGKDDAPAYFAVAGQAIGYNASVPITLMVGFTGSVADAASLLHGYVRPDQLPPAGRKGEYIVGFSVINSEETPGLGEKIKDSRPPYTWLQAVTGAKPPPNPDQATDFQRQFRGRTAETLALKKSGGDLDAITASTITSNAVVSALKNAGEKLQAALAAK
ncbi:MAG: FMN-binding protein [Planctomycetes bacterium]|nr:FMN-binding protein [Planctomycetota bacterium]